MKAKTRMRMRKTTRRGSDELGERHRKKRKREEEEEEEKGSYNEAMCYTSDSMGLA